MASSISIQVAFKDEAGKVASTSFNVPSGTSLANAGLAAKEAALLMDAITDGQITGLTMSFPVALPAGLKSEPADTSRVGLGALFSWLTSGGHYTRMNIPTRKESIVTDDTDVINQADTAVAAFIAEMTAGLDLTGVGGTGTVAPTDTRDEDITAVDDAYETVGGKRRRA